MSNPLFYINPASGVRKTYDDLFADASRCPPRPLVELGNDLYSVFVQLVANIGCNQNQYLTDAPERVTDVPEVALVPVESSSALSSCGDLRRRMEENRSTVGLFTSGTTGKPKLVQHATRWLLRQVASKKHPAESRWAFTYNPTHMGGLQVLFQALLHEDPIIDLFRADRSVVLDAISRLEITHISATPTFFRLLLPAKTQFPAVRRVTCGGERLSGKLPEMIQAAFPNAKLNNLFAATEFGTLFASHGDGFVIDDSSAVKITNGILHVHRQRLGEFKGNDGEWYCTGDQVEIVANEPLTIRFIGREKDYVNVGGERIDLGWVEEVVGMLPYVQLCRISSRENSVTGRILMCDILLRDGYAGTIDIKTVIADLRGKGLQQAHLPRLIRFVDKIDRTRSGKMLRNA